MKSVKANRYQNELIGNHVSVVESSHPQILDIDGDIVDETLNTIQVSCDDGLKVIPKKGNVFEINDQGELNRLVGERLRYRPEDRIKRLG